MVHNDYCAVCDGVHEVAEVKADTKTAQPENKNVRDPYEDTSFAVLLALVPAMTMTLFSLIGLI